MLILGLLSIILGTTSGDQNVGAPSSIAMSQLRHVGACDRVRCTARRTAIAYKLGLSSPKARDHLTMSTDRRAGPAKHTAKTHPAQQREHWKQDPDEHDYPAAFDYLTLVLPNTQAAQLVAALRDAPIVHRKAKDLLRASRLVLLSKENPHVAMDLAKVRRGGRLSPVLVVRGTLAADVAMTVADGYHRVCASYLLDENADIPCRLVDSPS